MLGGAKRGVGFEMVQRKRERVRRVAKGKEKGPQKEGRGELPT